MSDDLLERATRALREESAPTVTDLAETRARLLASSTTKKTRRTNALRWVLPLAAAFAAGTAFAATNGQLERAVRAVQTWLVEAPEVATAKPKRKHVAHRRDVLEQKPSVVAPVAPVSEPVEPAVLPPPMGAVPLASSAEAEPVVREKPMAPRGQRELRESSRAANSDSEGRGRDLDTGKQAEAAGVEGAEQAAKEAKPAPAPNADLALYREAHRAHFVDRNYADALTLWNGYLARFPAGIFTLEARYNRAIALVRLGRKQEAAQALSPFAQGEVKGAYRRDEARALLDALNKKP